MTTEEDTPTPIRVRIEAIEAYLDTLHGGAGEDAAIMVTLSSTLAQLHQAEAAVRMADSLDELAAFTSGVMALLDTPGVMSLLEQFGLGDPGDDDGEGEDGDEDEDEEPEEGDEDGKS